VSGAIAGYVTAARNPLSSVSPAEGYRSRASPFVDDHLVNMRPVVRRKRQSELRSPELRDERNGQMSSRMRRLGSADG